MTTLLPLHDGRSLQVEPGPSLLAAVADGPTLEQHTARTGSMPRPTLDELVAVAQDADLRGRGGAGFPFARKLVTTARARGRAAVVVNCGEGEPASHKDAALSRVAPHLVLDGAVVTAHALHAREVHVVVPGDRSEVGTAVRRALRERAGTRPRRDAVRWSVHTAEPRFVAGQVMAVLELMSGRPNLPVTTWRPAAESGHRGRPTLLSNAETFAHVAGLLLHGEPAGSTTMLTLDGDGPTPRVREVAQDTPWTAVLSPAELVSPVLLGGYHGTWAPPGALEHRTVSRGDLQGDGLTLGAGVVLPLVRGCPLDRTAQVLSYLAQESAGRCGPCMHGLPALALALHRLREHGPDPRAAAEVARLAGMVEGRGACAHPDGSVRLVRSLLRAFPDEAEAHANGLCRYVAATEHGREVLA